MFRTTIISRAHRRVVAVGIVSTALEDGLLAHFHRSETCTRINGEVYLV